MRSAYLPFGRPSFGEGEEEAIVRVLRSGWIGMGAETIQFEQELAAHVGVPEMVTVNSCTSALFLSLLVSGVTRDDEVIVPSLTWCSTANAAMYLDAQPVFCDVDPNTMCATWETIEPHISPKTKAVIVVHYGGLAADTQTIRRKLPNHIALIEDAAHAFGTLHADGSMVGTHGNLTCYSFYANKNLSCGEGGAIALKDKAVADKLRQLRLHALATDAWKRFTNKTLLDMGLRELGYKMNFTDMQACIGRVQLKRQSEFHERRMRIVAMYKERLPRILPEISWQEGWDSGRHVAHLFVVKLPVEEIGATRNDILLFMRKHNIGAAVHYAPLHTMPLYNRVRRQATLPVVEWLDQRIMTLPISASMNDADCDDVLAVFEESIASHDRRLRAER